MLKKTITFEDLETGAQRSEDWYFNLSKAELIEMEVTAENGYEESMKRIVASKDGKAIMAEFERFIMMSVGERTEQGGFRKTEEIRQRFKESPAYSELFMELVTKAEAGAAFLTAIVPQQLGNRVNEIRNQRAREEAMAKVQEETGRSYGKDARQVAEEYRMGQQNPNPIITPTHPAPIETRVEPRYEEVIEPRPYTAASDSESQERNTFDQQTYSPDEVARRSLENDNEFRAQTRREAREQLGQEDNQ